jgi:alkylation response protein AidB-like acyl-CoA dehydrogenase
MDPHEHRRQNYTLTEEEEAVRVAFAGFFQKEVPTTLVRAAEPLGFDPELWHKAVEAGLTSMSVPEEAGGDGAGIVEMTLVAEELGRRLAPIPLIEHVVATRLLASAGDPAFADLVEQAIAGERILAFAPRRLDARRIVHTAAVAHAVVGFDGDGLVVASSSEVRDHVPNQASLPFAWVDPAVERVLPVIGGTETIFERALGEWKVLTAAALIGLTEAALALAVDFAKTRETMGTLIGKLQGVQFPLADVHMWVVGGRNLSRRAAWFLDNEPESERALPYEAIAYAAQAAVKGTSIAAHVQGGLGFIGESDASLYFLRAKGWALGGGSVAADLRTAGELILADHRARREHLTDAEEMLASVDA